MTTNPSKIERLTFHNARSYGHIELDLHPGLNVIVGDSDAGKTNIYRNVVSLVNNDSFDSLATVGATCTHVTAKFTDGVSVQLFKEQPPRGKGVNQYVVSPDPDGGPGEKTYDSVGSGVPPRVAEILGLGPVDMGGETVEVHFASQRGAAFLVDSSANAAAKIVGSVSGLDSVFSATKTAADQQREAKNAVAACELSLADARDAEARAVAAASIPGLSEALERAAAAIDSAAGFSELADRLRRVTDDAVAAVEVARSVPPVAEIEALLFRAEGSLSEAAEASAEASRLGTAIEDTRLLIDASRVEDKQVLQTEHEFVEHEVEFARALKAAGVCPVCGKST